MTGRKLDVFERIPKRIWTHLGQQIGVASPELATLRSLYTTRAQTLYDHQQVACDILGFREMSEHQRRYVVRWLRETLAGRGGIVGLLPELKRWFYEHQILLFANRGLKRFIAEAVRDREAMLLDAVMTAYGPERLTEWADAITSERSDGTPMQAWLGKGSRAGRVTLPPLAPAALDRYLVQRSLPTTPQIEAREVVRLKGENGVRVNNGTRGRIDALDQTGLNVLWDDGRKTQLSNGQARFVDHSYARTTYKEQGATNKYELVMVSETGARIFNRLAAYVAATRAKLNTEVITSDVKSMLRNADKETALTKQDLGSLVTQAQAHRALQVKQQRAPARPVVRSQELTRH